jgi:phosphate:Na+ symporter
MTDSLQISAIVIGLFGGLALFLFGLEQLTSSLRSVAGERMRRLLGRATSNRFKAAFTGAFVTAISQSSSVTTVLLVGFISAGLMSLAGSVGVIMGANIGSTVTAQIIAFKITQYALIPIAVGYGMRVLLKKEQWIQYGTFVMGLGLGFFGMDLMGQAMQPLRSYDPFIEAMAAMEQAWLGILAGALFTALVQSSAATTGIIIVLASQGVVTLESGIALAFGANIGTCVTALLAALGKPRPAVRAAAVHILFNVVGVLIWLWLIDELALAVRSITPSTPGLSGMALLAADTPRQIANAHTLFNVANTVIFIWFTRPIARFAGWLIPDRPAGKEGPVQPRYLDDVLLGTPALALDRARMELRRLGERALAMIRQALPVAVGGSGEELHAVARLDDDVDELHASIVTYLGRLSLQGVGEAQSERLSMYMAAANYMENIGDMVETNVVGAGLERIEHGVVVSEPTREVLKALHERVVWAVELAFEALDASNSDMARMVSEAKAEVSLLADEAERHLSARLTADEAGRLVLYRIESELIEYLKRVYYFAKRIARLLDPERIQKPESTAAR